jgi:hypothetical protein
MKPLILTEQDKALARQTADAFIQWSIQTQSTDRPHTRYKAWESDHQRKQQMQLAYGAEIAIARLLNLSWNGLDTFKNKADVGDNIEVRYSSVPYLILRPNDRESDIAFLVQGSTLDRLFLGGFMPVKMGRTPTYKLKDEETWFIPRESLYAFIPQYQAVQAFLQRLATRSQTP